MERMNTKMNDKSFDRNPRGARWAGLLGLLLVAPVGCGPEERQLPEEGGSGVMASYRGTQVSLEWLLRNREAVSCDDHLGHGIISCYDSHTEMMASLKSGKVSAQACGTHGTQYATIWEHFGYSGSSFTLFYDYSNLGSIGWNDRISAVQVVSGCSARFFQNAGYDSGAFGGPIPYSENTWYVGDVFNDQFSSVSRGG